MPEPSRRLPPLNALRAFEAAARHLSFTEAARELHVTQGAISRHVKTLEAGLGVRLFLRHHRGLSLTPEGKALLAPLGAALDQIAQAVGRLTARRNLLKVKLPPTFAVRWLLRRIERFQRAWPDLQLQLTTAWPDVDFEREDFDAGILYGTGSWPGLHATPLLRERLTPVCAPALLRRGPPLDQPADLRRHVLLQSVADHRDWLAWARVAGVDDIDSARCQEFDILDLALQAAADGHGVAMADLSLIGDDLASGRLVAPFRDVQVVLDGYWLVCRAADADRQAITRFRRWLVAEVAAAEEG